MAIRKILQSSISGGTDLDDKFLHGQTVLVQNMSDEVKQLIADLRETLWAYPFCVGLSAPQIGENLAISVVNFKRENPDDDLILINPKVIELSGKKDRKRESCMSVWGEMGEVERRDKISIEYLNINFEQCHANFKGFDSRVVQHELDHLQGILYSDKIFGDTKLQHADFFDEYKII